MRLNSCEQIFEKDVIGLRPEGSLAQHIGVSGSSPTVQSAVSSITSESTHQNNDIMDDYGKFTLHQLKTVANKLGIESPIGHKGHRSTWISAIQNNVVNPTMLGLKSAQVEAQLPFQQLYSVEEGRLNVQALECLSSLREEYSRGKNKVLSHVTLYRSVHDINISYLGFVE